MIAIETASEKDFPAIAELNVCAYAEFAERFAPGGWEIMQKNLRAIAEKAKSAQFLIYRCGSEICGSVAYCPAGNGDPRIFKTDMAAILLLAVHPKQRGKGIARALIETCISRAKGDQANSIGLFTNEFMQPAQHLYRSFGFEQEDELPMRYGVRYFRFVLALI